MSFNHVDLTPVASLFIECFGEKIFHTPKDTNNRPLSGLRLSSFRELESLLVAPTVLSSKTTSEQNLQQLRQMVEIINKAGFVKASYVEYLTALLTIHQCYLERQIPDSMGVNSRVSESLDFKMNLFDPSGVEKTVSYVGCEPEIRVFLSSFGNSLQFIRVYHLITSKFARGLKDCFSKFNKPLIELESRQGLLFSAMKESGANMGQCFCLKTSDRTSWSGEQMTHHRMKTVVEHYQNEAIYLLEASSIGQFKNLLIDTRDHKTPCCLVNIGFKFKELLLRYPHVKNIVLNIPDYYQFCEHQGVSLLCLNYSDVEFQRCLDTIPDKYKAEASQ
ncbi:hypothetical protein D5R81_04380 [Parashewanella spongiae]|uniref:Uncharacterized protein n=1 Tax=Parashewanella spongiae TaxID=342950 RepID=A0A3A6U9L7_9GAMM|nr:hypothetical protein [Parashewanella spongiae]MCL1077507.1 hypothetical protein [Parashewanella spongiae]RJY18636.1 hypothetical protein D5R81_04380 [Parashewanella spongiae]